MKKPSLVVRLVKLALPAVLVATANGEIGLISPQEASAAIEAGNAVVLDTRGGYKDYFKGHIPAAQHLNFDTLRGTDAGVPVQYLPAEITVPLLLRAGATAGKTHIIYATGEALPNDEILSASMVAYVLEKYGIEDIRIVDGGLPGWKSAGLKVSQDYHSNPAGKLPANHKADVAASAEEVITGKEKKDHLLVDARPLNEFQGRDEVWLRKGHIPGAISFHWARLMDSSNTHKFKPFSEVKAELEAAGITPEKEITCYCGTSREGSLLRFYLKYVANYPNVRLYEGAWKEYVWLKDKSLPAEEGGKAAGL